MLTLQIFDSPGRQSNLFIQPVCWQVTFSSFPAQIQPQTKHYINVELENIKTLNTASCSHCYRNILLNTEQQSDRILPSPQKITPRGGFYFCHHQNPTISASMWRNKAKPKWREISARNNCRLRFVCVFFLWQPVCYFCF